VSTAQVAGERLDQEPGLQASLATYRQIMWRIVPIFTILWICAWLDRTNISFAKLHMADDLGLSDAAYGFGAGVFFLGYLIFEVPCNLLLMRIGARKTLTRIALGWGIISILMMFTQSASMFYVLRFLLGACEAGMYPGGLLYFSLSLPASHRGKAIAIFTAGGAISGVIGAPLAGVLLTRFDGLAGIAGWQWLFLVEGALSIIVGVIFWFVVSDDIRKAPWLSPEQQRAVTEDLAREEAASGQRHEFIGQALRQPMLWLFCFLYICNSTGYTAIAFWGPSLMAEAGVGDAETIGWIVSAISMAAAIFMYLAGLSSGRTGDAKFHLAGILLVCALGMAALSFSLGSAGGVVGAIAVSSMAASAAVVVFWNMPGRFFAGNAVAVAIALISSVANVGAFLAPTLLGAVKESTGSVAPSLWGVAIVYLLASLATLVFIRQERRARPKTVI